MALTVLGVALAAGAFLGTRALLAEADASRSPSDDLLCGQYRLLVDHLASDDVFSTQSSIRAARKLSDLADDASEPDVRAAGEDMRTVISSVAWENSDLLTATRPIALSCGWAWPIGPTPPAGTPRPPAS